MKKKTRSDNRLEKKITITLSDGSKKRVSVYGKTNAELERNADELKFKSRTGEYKKADIRFKEYAENWYNAYIAIKRTNTRRMYRICLDTYILPEIGHIKLTDITKNDIQCIITNNFVHARTCQQIRLTVSQIMDHALDDDLINKNPCKRLTMPESNSTTKRPLTKLELQGVKNANFTDREKAFVYILFYCGLAKCEALALTKNSFDFKKWEIKIENDLIFDKGHPKIEATKTKYRLRTVPVPLEARNYIKVYIASIKSIYLFTKKDGSLMTDSAYDRMWEQIVKKINDAVCNDDERKLKCKKIEGLTAYIFRHNYATMLYYSEISIKKAVQLMGHRDATMITKVYAHLDEEKENAKEKINNCIVLKA